MRTLTFNISKHHGFKSPATRTLSALALGLALAAGAPAAELPELRVGMDPTFEPYEYKTPDGKLVGFDVDFANALCAQLKMKCVFVEQAWAGIIPSLMAKKYDVIISSLTINEDRKKVILFTDKYSGAPNRMVAKRGSGIDGTPATLAGKKIGVGKGSAQEAYARKIYGAGGATVVGYAGTADAYLDLAAGRVDAVIASQLEVKTAFLSKPSGKDYKYVGPELEDAAVFGVGSGMGLRKEDTALRDKINAAVKVIRSNGEYKKINDKYFDFDAYGK